MPARFICLSIVVLLLGTGASRLQSQQTDCQTGCTGTYAVSVTPDTSPHDAAVGANRVLYFLVYNTGTNSETFSLACFQAGHETCVGVSQSSVTLPADESIDIYVTFTPGSLGTTGTIGLSAIDASRGVSDSGSYLLTNVTGPAPIVATTQMNPGMRIVDPFDGIAAHSTPPYWSLGTEHSVLLAYNSATVKPTPVVIVDVTNSDIPYPSTYSVQVQLASNGVRLHLLNGTDSAFYVAGTIAPSRLVAAIDALANGLTTGAYDVNVTVTAHYGAGPRSTTVASRLLVENEIASLFGTGWQIAGVQRIRAISGSYSVLVTNGDGSISYFRRDCSTCAFISPLGDPTRLFTYAPDSIVAYRRAAPDSSAVDFRSDGRMVQVWSGELNRVISTLAWSDTQLTSIRDQIGKRITFGYSGSYSSSGKLQTITDPAGRITALWTDAQGQLYKITDPDSGYSTFSYDGSFRLTASANRGGATSNLTYDAISRLDTTKAPSFIDYSGSSVRPTTIAAAYERLVWQPAITGADSAHAKANVQADTVMSRIIDAVGNLTRVAYDEFGGSTKIIDPLGRTTAIVRDTLGQPTWISEPSGHVIANNYSGYLLASTSDNASGHYTNFTYNSFSRPIVITGNGSTVRTDIYYHAAYILGGDFGPVDSVYVGNAGSHDTPAGGFMAARYTYNSWGRDSIITDGAGHTTRFQYSDTAHYANLAQVTDPLGRITSKSHYATAGRPDTVWTPSSGAMVASVMTYDPMNRLLTMKDPLGFTTQYSHGPENLNRVVDPKGQIYRFDYNPLGWMSIQHDLADTTKADTAKYDVGGRVRSVRTRRGDTISLTYDALGRVVRRSGPDFPTDSFRYDPAGRWMVALNTNAYDSLAYDLAGRLVYSLERLTGDSSYVMTFTYDTLGRMISRSAPRGGNVVTHGYNRHLGVLDTVCAAGSCVIWGTRDGDNIAHSRAYGTAAHGWTMSFALDSAHRVKSDSFVPRGSGYSVLPMDTSFAKSFVYDTLGRLTNERPYHTNYDYGGYQYRYDADGRMLNACLDQTNFVQPIGVVFSCIDEYGEQTHPLVSSTNAYRYDSTGNRNDSMAAVIIGAGNRITRFKGYTIAYDLNGNILSKKGAGGSWGGDTTLLSWDASGALTRVERWNPGAAHVVVTYTYDALGRRVSKTAAGVAERYVHDGDQTVQDIDGATHATKAEYGWAPGADNLLYIRTSSWSAGVITDPQVGTVRGLANVEYGQIVKQYPASYWGVAVDTGYVVRFRDASREYDAEAGLYYNRARYYDPQLGRFVSEDRLGIAGSMNLYTYASNDPINVADPTGEDDCGITIPCPGGTIGGPTIWGDPNCAGYSLYYSQTECTIKKMECDFGNGSWDTNSGTCTTWDPQDPWDQRSDGGAGGSSEGQTGRDGEPTDPGKAAVWQCRVAIGKLTLTAMVDVAFGLELSAWRSLARVAGLRGAEAISLGVRGIQAGYTGAHEAATAAWQLADRQLADAGSVHVGAMLGLAGRLEQSDSPLSYFPFLDLIPAGVGVKDACFNPGGGN